MPEGEEHELPFDILDATKLIPEELYPLIPIGRMVLDRWPDNFFAETEQVAFCRAHLVPGIEFSEDPLLQGRISLPERRCACAPRRLPITTVRRACSGGR